MHFSLGAALAAMAIYAGQTIAASCHEGAPAKTNFEQPQDCVLTDIDGWYCGNGVSVERSGDNYIVTPGSRAGATVSIICSAGLKYYTCNQGPATTFHLACGGSMPDVQWY
ncbi:hypothetical protein E4U53_006420 [Claviceps sorghi]|nr:hypothetical protein E4U53_006420 [Claviceps sorghi]